jgi:putative ABC transport system permease protein
MTPLNKVLLRDLLHLRGQVAAVAMVVACGIATYVTMRSSYDSLVISRADYYSTYRFADVFAHLKRAPDSLRREIAAIPGVAAAETRVVVESTLDVPGLDEPATGRLVSIPERRIPILNDLFIRKGRYVEPGRGNEALVSEAFASANKLDIGQSIGAVINGHWEPLTIVGIALSPEYVYEIRGEVLPDNRRFGVLWVSREALGPAFDLDGAFNDVALTLGEGASEPGVIARLDSMLDPYGGLGAYGRRDQLSHRFLSDEIAQDRITGIFVPSIFLGIAAFLIHITLSRLVAMQRNQIAVLKAFGYSNADIAYHYLKFAMAMVLVGTGAGIALGIWLGSQLAALYENFFRFPELQFNAGPGLMATAIAISAGAAAGGALLAVRNAVSLPPAEAMRPKPPARFRPGLAERLGLERILSISARLIMRNIERRPLKALLAVSGIALAASIIVVGRYFFDALDHIMLVQFQTVQREDVSVVYNQPLTSRARHDISRLPGVLRAEPFRIVPVRLRFEHRARRVGILGLSPDAELRRLVDSELREVRLSPDGIVLTRSLAESLGATAGDSLTVEVLEANKPVRHVMLTGFVDELIGFSAYMDIRGLNRLMREGDTTSGAYLAVDPLEAPGLYSTLKRMPVVGAVEIRDATLASFKTTIAESLTISTSVLILFACIIAFGIVYNGARIALSERGNELASLRVLGFTRREVSMLLLGEQATVTLLGIPVGCLLGVGISAVLSRAMQSEIYRMPLVISAKTFVFAAAIIAVAAILSGLLVVNRLRRLDLIAVLKTRE